MGRLVQVKTTGKSVITDWTADAVVAGRHHGTEQVLFEDAAAENVEDGLGRAVDEVLLSAVQDAAKKQERKKVIRIDYCNSGYVSRTGRKKERKKVIRLDYCIV